MTAAGTLPDLRQVSDLARRLRSDSIRATNAAGSGHPTSAMSAADLAAVLFARHFTFDADHPDRTDNDRFVLSKGHGAPLLYALMASFGLVAPDQLIDLRAHGSPLEGHPVPGVPLVDVATGSLGQGLSNGLGMALGQRIRGFDSRTWVLLGDSEMAEGAVWEAMELAGHLRSNNLSAIVDLNRLGQRGPTMHGWETAAHVRRAEALGWAAVEFDGHDLNAIDAALGEAVESDRPSLLVARTLKGKGVSFAENDPQRHGKPFDDDEMEAALAELGEHPTDTWRFARQPDGSPAGPPPEPAGSWQRPTFTDPVSTRDAFGAALRARAEADPRLVVLDAEVSDSTRSRAAAEVLGDRFIQAYIAEQNMVGMAVGLQSLGFYPVAATFGAFLTRAHDFIRMGHIGGAHLLLVGSHAGVSIGEDGPSQMALEDIAMMRATEAVVLYPADGTATSALLDLALDHDGIAYLRTTRGSTPALYAPGTDFRIGGAHVHGAGERDHVTIVAAGVTLFESLEAARKLRESDVRARVVDAYSVAPLDVATLRQCLDETGTVVTVEDHRRPGGLGEAVAATLAATAGGQVISLAVDGIPGSASPEEQRRHAGIDADSIAEAVRGLDAFD